MDEYEILKERLAKERLVKWDDLPDLGLYRDQVLSYMQRQHILQRDRDFLTGAMINNYIKIGLMPRATDKKYSREHLAYLSAICTLKQVLGIGDTAQLLDRITAEADIDEFYEYFRDTLDRALNMTQKELVDGLQKNDLVILALQLALKSYAQKLTCERILDLLSEQEDCGDGNQNDNN